MTDKKKADEPFVMITVDPVGEDVIDHYSKLIKESQECLELAGRSSAQVDRVNKLNERIMKLNDDMYKQNVEIVQSMQNLFADANQMAQLTAKLLNSLNTKELTFKQQSLCIQLEALVESFIEDSA